MTDAARFQALEDQVAYLMRETEGEKVLSRHIFEQTRQNSELLATLIKRVDRVEARLDRVETRLDRVEERLDRVEARLDQLERKFDAFVETFPRIVAEVVREVLREERSRPS